MGSVRPALKLVDGNAAAVAKIPLEATYEHFRLELMGNRVSPNTLRWYDHMIRPFLDWAREQGIGRWEELKVERHRHYRALVASRDSAYGRPLEGGSVLAPHKALMIFFRWAVNEGYPVEGRLLGLKRPIVPDKEATVYHVHELRTILAACAKERPSEEVTVRTLVGSGARASEVCGLAVTGPDGLSDLMTDSLIRGRVELRVRWNAGAKGQKSRRVPISPKLASAIKRYEARHRRRDVAYPNLLINHYGRPFQRYGIDAMMDRLQGKVGFRVHAHAFRHTFATVACQLGWPLEHLRAAMGHADYKILQHYVRLATERDLGHRKEWLEFIVPNPSLNFVQ